jgi:glucose/arabinose dehydrogenase
MLAPAAHAIPPGTHVEVYKSGLDAPIDLAWVPGTSKMFFTEKNTGRVRVMIGRRLLARPCVDLNVNPSGEAGALGIALHPNYRKNHWLYVFYTNADPLENRVTRWEVIDNRCRRAKAIVRGLRASTGYHNGGQLEFVDRKLFVSTGEDHNPSLAQNTGSRHGKILRYHANGSVPDDNPFGPRNPVWSYGHRNPFGLANRPGTSWLFETENGPNCDDELNRIRKGRNYGWGANYQCGGSVGPNAMGPMRRWTPPIVPTDLTWYRGQIKALNGSLYMAEYMAGRVHRFRLNDAGTRVVRHTIVYDHSGSLVDVAKGPGGLFYLVTGDSILRIAKN